MNRNNTKILLVEGDEDKRVIPYLMEENGIPWPKGNEPVDIQSYNGVEKLLEPKQISTQFKPPRVTALGIMVDADDNPLGRWQKIRDVCLPTIPDFPQDLPDTGLIHQIQEGLNQGKKIGVWMMPDNRMQGMLETFLAYLIPTENEPLWTYTQTVIQEAKNLGATFIENHTDKAKIHTWLAWQNPPGRQLHNAVMERILNPNHPKSQIFINWFKTLYDL
ncbi:DUF3226 domain-containing protein [Gloeothece verrucosa]|uniref:DUF4435 domain-containing protein n=1 Tax=Gloeothece verrucosa (strain PCC 7822) TaxID=497965 RepID=E0UDW0_GLOV7|nr:DUF3226 domain-containing protein [Gloeothece verrucosa]ADN16545.1 conserved hypothetical protein [Gloeothece verrucosa PCC 7822]